MDKPRIRMITPVWGAPYIERWLGFCFASLRSDGNIPYLVEHCDFELAIVTKSADAAFMQESPRFKQVMSGIRVRFILMDEFFPRTGKTGYGVPLTLAYAKAIADLGDDGVGTFVMLMNADCVLASGSLESVVRRIRRGETIVVGQSLRAVDGSARDRLLARVDENGVLAIAPRALMQLVDAALHSTVTARIVNEPGIVEANYYHQIFWRISDDCLAMRAFMLHPICFRLDRRLEKVVCPMDYGFLLELCPDGRFGVLDYFDEFLIVELQDRDFGVRICCGLRRRRFHPGKGCPGFAARSPRLPRRGRRPSIAVRHAYALLPSKRPPERPAAARRAVRVVRRGHPRPDAAAGLAHGPPALARGAAHLSSKHDPRRIRRLNRAAGSSAKQERHQIGDASGHIAFRSSVANAAVPYVGAQKQGESPGCISRRDRGEAPTEHEFSKPA